MTVRSSPLEELSVDHVEFFVADPVRSAQELVARYGFTAVGSHHRAGDHRSIALRHGPSRFVVTEGLSSRHPARGYVQRHGDGVANVGLRVPDAVKAFDLAVARGASVVAGPQAGAGFVTATIGGFGDVSHTFLQRPPRGPAGAELPGFAAELPALESAASAAPVPELQEVDHFAACLEAGSLDRLVDFYRTVLDFEVTFEERIAIGAQAMSSKVVQSRSGKVTLTLIEPDPGASAGQIDDFLKDHGGPGVQHVAFRAGDVVGAVTALSARGVEFLATSGTYYDRLAERIAVRRYDLEVLRSRGILVDEDHDGQLFQIFARSTHPRRTFFYEVIERFGARSFGSNNIKALYEAVEAERTRPRGAP